MFLMLRSGVCSSGKEEKKSCFAHSSKSHGWHSPNKTTLPVEEITTYNVVMIMPVRMCTQVHEFLKNTYSVAVTFDYRLKSSLNPQTHSRLVAAGFPEHAGNVSVIYMTWLCWSSGLSGFILCGSSLRSVWSKQTFICIDLLICVVVSIGSLPLSPLFSCHFTWSFWL